jgi:hypothetical protein
MLRFLISDEHDGTWLESDSAADALDRMVALQKANPQYQLRVDDVEGLRSVEGESCPFHIGQNADCGDRAVIWVEGQPLCAQHASFVFWALAHQEDR